MSSELERIREEFDILLHKYLHRDGIYSDGEFFDQILKIPGLVILEEDLHNEEGCGKIS